MIYADIIVDISHENLDKTYQYAVPVQYETTAVLGALVMIPFGRGNRLIKGYIITLSETPKIDVKFIKEIHHVVEEGLVIESHFIRLAYWIKENYGATMNDALKTVIPIKKSVKKKENKYLKIKLGKEETIEQLAEFKRKKNSARVRLLEALLEEESLEYAIVLGKLNIGRATIKGLEELGIIEVNAERVYRNPVKTREQNHDGICLNEEQKLVVDSIYKEYSQGIRKTYLIHGVTGSGKTEVYMEIIAQVIAEGKQVIMLIPEIALTYQTVMRFYKRFGDRISIMNSRLSSGERYDQYVRAKNGEIDIMIGPRSALFTPFSDLGLIILDEEHEGSYKSDSPPKYHAREVAIQRAEMVSASVILGTATPSLETYTKVMEGKYSLFQLKHRGGEGTMPTVWVVDLREELKMKNRSMFSNKLKALIQDRLEKKQQIMLFINRRGYAGFVSCRSCGHVIKCPHCDVSLNSHNNGKLLCHYCGYEEEMKKTCPSCGSKYIAAFGTGTQKVEESVKKEFPRAKVLRMDSDTTSGKEGHAKILSVFANEEADILVGTQMIVKGHDFTNVTLVGIMAADLSLYANDYRASEKTFQLLSQASGRAGRGREEGEVVIQTYNPDHYSIVAAAHSDYESFYKQEMAYRSLLSYPPVAHILAVLTLSKDEAKVETASELLVGAVRERKLEENEIQIVGPGKASMSKINDIHRRILYIKSKDYECLVEIKNYLEGYIQYSDYFKGCSVQFDFNPIISY